MARIGSCNHSTTRFNAATKRRDRIKVRDLKNLVGRAGRAGKETRGLVLIPHSDDFEIIKQVIEERNRGDVKGWLQIIVSRITNELRNRSIELSNELLDGQPEPFLQWIDTLDIALIDLLSEDIVSDQLSDIIEGLIGETLSYFQSNVNERTTLTKLFSLRSEKLKLYINSGQFTAVKRSGANLRTFSALVP